MLASISDIGFSLTRGELLGLINNYIKENNKQALFPAGGPTKEWYKSFMNRHKDRLHTKFSNNMPLNRALAMNPALFDHWFNMVKKNLMITIYTINRLIYSIVMSLDSRLHRGKLLLFVEKVVKLYD